MARKRRFAAAGFMLVALSACGASGRAATTKITPAPSSSAASSPPPSTAAPKATTTVASTTTTTAPHVVRHVFPVQPASITTYSHSHHDYPATDIIVHCGSRFVAAVDGVVLELRRSDPWVKSVNDPWTRGGLYVSILGDDGVRYYGAHLSVILPFVAPHVRVTAGEQLGLTGDTGDAKGTCHLHFGLSPNCPNAEWAIRRGILYPWPYLDDWRSGGNRSPAREVDAWASGHPTACADAARGIIPAPWKA